MPTKQELIEQFIEKFDDWNYSSTSDAPDNMREDLYQMVGEKNIFTMALEKMTNAKIQELIDKMNADMCC